MLRAPANCQPGAGLGSRTCFRLHVLAAPPLRSLLKDGYNVHKVVPLMLNAKCFYFLGRILEMRLSKISFLSKITEKTYQENNKLRQCAEMGESVVIGKSRG